jgi:hypothetical protein
MSVYDLQLRLLFLSQQVGHQQVADLEGGFIQVEIHALSAESLANDVELDTNKDQ